MRECVSVCVRAPHLEGHKVCDSSRPNENRPSGLVREAEKVGVHSEAFIVFCPTSGPTTHKRQCDILNAGLFLYFTWLLVVEKRRKVAFHSTTNTCF